MQETYKKQQERHIISINGTDIIGRDLCLMAGPCSIESEEQITKIANYVSGLGIKVIRGGAYKPRTSPYSFQGLGEQGFIFLNNECTYFKGFNPVLLLSFFFSTFELFLFLDLDPLDLPADLDFVLDGGLYSSSTICTGFKLKLEPNRNCVLIF